MLDATDPSLINGRLKKSLSFWKDELEASPAILDVIAHGFVLPLKLEPNPYMGKNQASALANKEFVQECIDELLVAGCIQQVRHIPHVCSPLSVVESKAGKKRLVVNLRYLLGSCGSKSLSTKI